MPHVEQLLALDAANEEARKVAQKLVVIKGLAGRAAAALRQRVRGLRDAPGSGPVPDASSSRARAAPSARACWRASATCSSERLGDDKGAFEAFEQALAIDATDDDLRARYVALARQARALRRRGQDARRACSRR